MPVTPQDRRQIARLAAHASWAQTPDRTARTAPARAALLVGFENQVDPERRLTPVERRKRAESARKSYYAALALRSARARRQRSEAATEPGLSSDGDG